MDETERRRTKQLAHNKQHGITPVGIHKKVTDILEGAYVPGAGGRMARKAAVAEKQARYAVEMEGGDVWKTIQKMVRAMQQAAQDLTFTITARMREPHKQ